MRPARTAALTLLAIACLPLLLAAAAWAVSRTDWAAGQAAARASAALGQPVRLAGLSIGFLPRPSVELDGLEVGPDGATGPLLSVERATATLGWRELLRAPMVLERLQLEGPVLRPRVDATGADNWSALVERLVELAGTGPAAFDVGQLGVERGRLEYSDAARHGTVEIAGLVLEARGLRPAAAFPLQLRFGGQAREQVFHAALEATATVDTDRAAYALEAGDLRGWIGGGAFGHGGADLAGEIRRLSLGLGAGTLAIEDFDFDAFGLRGHAQARAGLRGDAWQAQFAVVTRPFAPRAVANALGRPLPGTADPAALGEAVLEADGRWDAAGLTLDRLEGRLDDTAFAGSLQWPAPPAVPKLALSLDEVDLGRYLPPGAGEPASPAEALGVALGASEALRLDAVVEIGTASLAGATARGLRVVVTPPEDGAAER